MDEGVAQAMKWKPGSSYGPVLSQTELYLLKPALQIHPILTASNAAFHLIFNLASGTTVGFNPDSRDRDLPFSAKDEAATLPRVSELIIITRHSPWCTIVKNKHGVTLADVCGALFKDYTDIALTEAEMAAAAPAYQERVRRTAVVRETGGQGSYWSTHATIPVNRCRRIDWLQARVFFERLDRDDDFAKTRLGFAAPNIFCLTLTA